MNRRKCQGNDEVLYYLHAILVTAIYVRISEEEVAKALQTQADRFFALTHEPKPLVVR